MIPLEVRHAARQFVASRSFSAIAVLTLALGIGASAAIFSVVDAVLIRPSPLPRAEQLAVIWGTDGRAVRHGSRVAARLHGLSRARAPRHRPLGLSAV